MNHPCMMHKCKRVRTVQVAHVDIGPYSPKPEGPIYFCPKHIAELITHKMEWGYVELHYYGGTFDWYDELPF